MAHNSTQLDLFDIVSFDLLVKEYFSILIIQKIMTKVLDVSLKTVNRLLQSPALSWMKS